MDSWRQIGWAVILVAFVTGCSGYGSHYSATDDPGRSAATGIERDLEPGDRVRVTFADRSRVEGEIQSVDRQQLVLETEDDEFDLVIVEAAAIVSIEKYSNRGQITKIVLSSVIVGGLIAVVIIAASYSGPFE